MAAPMTVRPWTPSTERPPPNREPQVIILSLSYEHFHTNQHRSESIRVLLVLRQNLGSLFRERLKAALFLYSKNLQLLVAGHEHLAVGHDRHQVGIAAKIRPRARIPFKELGHCAAT